MSIAIHTQSTHAPARRLARPLAVERDGFTQTEQLREARGLMRHLVLAFAATGAALYAIAAVGLPI